jgi:hypothetical protein
MRKRTTIQNLTLKRGSRNFHVCGLPVVKYTGRNEVNRGSHRVLPLSSLRIGELNQKTPLAISNRVICWPFLAGMRTEEVIRQKKCRCHF